jgi:formate hydrogenlyase transcriptional activator
MPTAASPMTSRNANHAHFPQHSDRFESSASGMVSIDTGGIVEKAKGETAFEGIIGSSPALRFVLAEVGRVAPTDSTVLLLGETGTGKELIARAVHNQSSRRGRPLFGHEKGAFTGATAQAIGRFEMANTGTLFLDEIGDLPPSLQPKLLRVLQEQEFERLGSGRTHRISVRLVAATHRDLTDMVAQQQFRGDLYYRLNVFPIELPPLRERTDDIPQLISHFVEEFARRMRKPIRLIAPEAMSALSSYSWPGNVRELQNLIERAVIRSNEGVLLNPLRASERMPVRPQKTTIRTSASGSLRDYTRSIIEGTLQESGWVIGGPEGAAAKLGLPRTSLISKMKQLGITRPSNKGVSTVISVETEDAMA